MYASLEEYLEETGVATTPRALRNASADLDSILIGVVYETDDEGMPTDTKVAETLRYACIEQAHFTTERSSGEGAIASASINGASYTYRTEAAVITREGREFSPAAMSLLRSAGLSTVSVVVHG